MDPAVVLANTEARQLPHKDLQRWHSESMLRGAGLVLTDEISPDQFDNWISHNERTAHGANNQNGK